MARLENFSECNKIAESCISRKPGTRNNWRKPTTEAGSRNSRLMECGFCKLLKLDSGAAILLVYFQRSRKRRNASAVKAALQQEKQVGRFEMVRKLRRETKVGCFPLFHLSNLWNLNLSGRLALMAGAASWQGNKDVQEDRWPTSVQLQDAHIWRPVLQLLQF